MSQKHGREYEHTLVNDIDDLTGPEVWVTSAGYSGNANADDCDIVVTVDPQYTLRGESLQFNIEAKKRQGDRGKRVSNAITGSSSEETGVEELQRLVDQTPRWAVPIVALKLDRCKLVVVNARTLCEYVADSDSALALTDRTQAIVDALKPRTTKSDNISVLKPETDQWPSARTASDDEVVLSDALGLPYEGDT